MPRNGAGLRQSGSFCAATRRFRTATRRGRHRASRPSSPGADPDYITLIKSPMVGTFYARPNPNADKFVAIGDSVETETTVCIIEAAAELGGAN